MLAVAAPATASPQTAVRLPAVPPLGAHLCRHGGQGGASFAVAAPHATSMRVCVFSPSETAPKVGRVAATEWALHRGPDGLWHGWVPGVSDGQRYGLRADGPWAPSEGHRFNPRKLLLDPYAQAVHGHYDGDDLFVGHRSGHPDQACPLDNAHVALTAVVCAPLPPPRPLAKPVDAAQRVIYECHIKAMTALHPDVPEALRGSYAGMAQPAVLAHLQTLGITTVSLMPVAHRLTEPHLHRKGLTNHWGYNTVAFSAPDTRFWSGTTPSARHELRDLVDTLHAHGFEVILDVVYNHTAESDEWGPTLSLRGLDNATYYHLLPHDPSGYQNWTGCGNSLNTSAPTGLRLVMDSLRHWVTQFGIDGFRFDLASTLGRLSAEHAHVPFHFDAMAPLLAAMQQDPVLRDKLLIAEPWDIGPGGYQLGAFGSPWLEWNDRFRDSQRRFWLGHPESLGSWAHHMAGSDSTFDHHGRPPHSSVNFVTAHDGFTLMDLVSHEHRHNLANGEHNRDGHGDNHSTNNGTEGPSDDPATVAMQLRQRKALLLSTVCALGTPMVLAGDEWSHSQGGNNNAYCQDNATTWLVPHPHDPLQRWLQDALACRRRHPALHARHWWHPHCPTTATWRRPDGDTMADADWADDGRDALMLHLRHADDEVLLLVTRGREPQPFALPPGDWQLDLCSDDDAALHDSDALGPRRITLHGPAMAVLHTP